MKQGNIISAYKTLRRMSALPLPLGVAYKLHKLKTSLQTQWDFQLEQEETILKDCNGQADYTGAVHFADDPPKGVEANETNDYGKGRKEFDKRMTELSSMEVDTTFTPVNLAADTPGLKLSIDDLASLEGFVNIQDE